MDLEIDISNYDHLIRLAKAAPHIIDEEMAQGVNEAVLLGEREAKRLVGVQTGFLRKSIIATPVVSVGGTASAMWGTNTTYARVHEFGRGPVHAKPGKYLRFVIDGKVYYRKSVKAAAGRFYMRDSKLHVRRELPKIGKRIMNRAVARWAGGG